MELLEQVYLSPEFSSLEAIEQEVDLWDATTAQWLADCPRRGQYAIEHQVEPAKEAVVLSAGRAIHAGMAVLYSGGGDELALQTVIDTFGKPREWRLPPAASFSHIHLGHLEVIFKNYLDWRKKHDSFQPIVVELSDIDFTDVIAAIWQLTPDNKVILGESKLVMRFMVDTKDGQVPFIYSGRPDLPIGLGGVNYILDHKSTNAYLSDYYFKQYRYSNQLRGYGAMILKLLKRTISGALINGVYIGERASLSDFKGEKFARYGPMSYLPAHLTEAIKNQYYWKKSLEWYKEQGYFPQHTSKLCSGCPFDTLCNASPMTRQSVIQLEYQPKPREFFDL